APREAARELYRAAEVFAYPSHEEGFGLPVAEAMACAIPVVTSTAEALREVGGDAVLYAGPRDVETLSRQLEQALEHAPLRERLARAGPERAALFSWDEAVERTWGELSDVVAERT